MRRLMLLAMLAGFAASVAFGQPSRWAQLPGTATDISVAPNGEVWIVGTDRAAGGYGIHRLEGGNWVRFSGGATRIAAGPQGPWVIDSEGAISRWDRGTWQRMPGTASDIGVGANGSVWAIGTQPEEGGFGIHRWNAARNNWDKMPGGAERIAVDPRGNAIVVNKAKEIHSWGGDSVGRFVRMPGSALDVAIGADGTIYIVGIDHGVYQWSGGNWTRREGMFDTVGVDPKGVPWAINARREIYAAGGGSAKAAVSRDVTAKLENLGIANNARYAQRIYARNPWDMKAYRGRVYIGSGNSNNDGPDTNAGPVDVTYYDPAAGKFGSEWQVNDEQIDLFRIVGGTLAIPGHDPRQDWRKGNFYRRVGDSSWQEMRTVGWAIHMYDIVERDVIYAAIATPTGAEVAVSADQGKSWTTHSVIKYPGARARTFLSTPTALCLSAHTLHTMPVVSLGLPVPFTMSTWMVTSKGVSPVMVDLFPGVHVHHMFAAKPEQFNGEVYYFGAVAPIDHNWKSKALYSTRDCRSARQVDVPGTWFHHAVAEGGRLYVATSDEVSGGRRNRLFASADGGTFKEILNFAHKGFARSFAILNGDFYFGIGSEAEAPHPETGTILRLKAADVPSL